MTLLSIMATVPQTEVPLINYIILFSLILLLALVVAVKWPLMDDTIRNSADSASQKRWVIWLDSKAIVILAFISTLLKIDIPEMIWWGLLGVVATGIGVTAWEKVKMNKIDKSAPTGTDKV